jgi:hypothetical protein
MANKCLIICFILLLLISFTIHRIFNKILCHSIYLTTETWAKRWSQLEKCQPSANIWRTIYFSSSLPVSPLISLWFSIFLIITPIRPLHLHLSPSTVDVSPLPVLSDIDLKLSGMIDVDTFYIRTKQILITISLKSSLFPTILLYLPQNLIFWPIFFFSKSESRSDSPLASLLASNFATTALSPFRTLPMKILKRSILDLLDDLTVGRVLSRKVSRLEKVDFCTVFNQW